MNIGLLYYLGGISEGLGIASAIISVILLIASVVMTVTVLNDGKSLTYHADDEEDERALKKGIRIGWIVAFVLLFVSIIAPTRKAVVAMYLVPKITNNERIQVISDKALDRIERILDCDLSGEEKEEKGMQK